MHSWPQLRNAPIVEGLVDIRVGDAATGTLDLLRNCAEGLAAEFPLHNLMRSVRGQLSFSSESGFSLSSGTPENVGYKLESTDGKWVAQFRLDGFTLSRLAPYTTWDDLSHRAIALWKEYRLARQPEKIVRLATRFINRIPLPLEEPFDNVFKTTFCLADSLPQSVAGFLLRIVVPFSGVGANAIITQALEANMPSCIFDLDVFSETPEGVTEDDAWSKLEGLRQIKNRLFFESLTPSALEKFR